MASTYSNLKIQLMATGENSTTWGDVTNVNLGTALEEAIVGSADVTFASANVTLSLSNTNTTQTARNMRLRCTGTTGGSTRNLVVPSIEKPYIVQNDCADSIVVKTSAGNGITVPAGKTMWVYNNGTDVVDATTHLTSLTLATALPVLSGGTGSNTASGARTNLGATTVGSNLFTLTNPSAITFPRINADNSVSTLAAAAFRTAIGSTTLGDNLFIITNPSAVTFPRFNADNTVSALNASDFRTAIGAGTSSTTGTVTSVAGTGTVNGLTLTGTVTTSGSLTLGGTLSGVSLTTQVTDTLPVANGGTGATSAAAALTALGAYPASNPNGYTSNVGTVTSVSGTGTVNGLTLTGTVTSSGNLTLGGTLANVSLTTQVTGTLPVANGGTGATSLTANNVLLGNGTSAVQVVAPGTSGNVLTSNGSTWVSSAPAGWTQIATVSTTSGYFATFGSIPATYNDLLVVYTTVGHDGSGADPDLLVLSFSSNGSTYTNTIYSNSVIFGTENTSGSVFIPGYTKTAGSGIFSPEVLTNLTAATGGAVFGWRLDAGLVYLRFNWANSSAFDAGTITLFGR